jgi:hypothetical protein
MRPRDVQTNVYAECITYHFSSKRLIIEKITNAGNVPLSELSFSKKFWEELIVCFRLIQQGSHRKKKSCGEDTRTDRWTDLDGRERDREKGDLIDLILFFIIKLL